MPNLSRRHLFAASAAVAAGVAFTNNASAQTPQWNSAYPVVVAGGGAAGCMAAIEAAKAGRKVLLLQAVAMLGGSSAISSGWIRSCNTVWHEKRGIKDSPAAYAQDILTYGNGTRDAEKARMIAELSGPFVNYLASIGVEFTDEEDRANGGDTLRIVKTNGGGGALMAKLAAAVQAEKNITVVTNAALTDVFLDDKKEKVVGCAYLRRKKTVYVKTPAVVIATGGFGRNQAYVEKFANEWKKTGRVMDTHHNGDGLRIATDLGAGAANLNIGMVCPTLEVTKNIFYSSAPLLNGGIFVNEQGRRFVNEYVIYTDTPRAMLKQKTTWEIVTKEMHPVVERMIKAGVTTKCESYEDLARVIGCPAANLKEDIEKFNAVTRTDPSQRKDDFGRKVWGRELTFPMYILQVTPVLIETVGGFTINAKSQVTTLMGKPVAKGLFGAGSAAFGEHFGPGYRSGEAYVYAGTTGMTAGREAAKLS